MATTPPGTSVIEHQVIVAARPETVFAYFTNPAKMVNWMGDEAMLDPQPGGICRIALGPAVMLGRYVEVVPYNRVAFSWGWETERGIPPASTMVEVSLTPHPEGTRVHLTHRQVPDAAVHFHRVGWSHYLPRLVLVAGGGHAGPDPLPGNASRMRSRSEEAT
jgi:uncharacterized protein YndB with AHSA1/START domain